MAINQSLLRQKAAAFQQPLHESLLRSASLGQVRAAFLCHSHKDELLVKGVLSLFQEAGIDLYVDWMDHSMPERPNAETAKKIQDAIRTRALFLFLATANAKASRWCPWEIGYADSSLKMIYIIPTTDGNTVYGNEYLQLYSHIDVCPYNDASAFAVFPAGLTKGEWLTSASFR